jgi:hypothetical protein
MMMMAMLAAMGGLGGIPEARHSRRHDDDDDRFDPFNPVLRVEPPDDPLSRPCPTCGADAGEPCNRRRPRMSPRRRFHGARLNQGPDRAGNRGTETPCTK